MGKGPDPAPPPPPIPPIVQSNPANQAAGQRLQMARQSRGLNREDTVMYGYGGSLGSQSPMGSTGR